MEEIKKQLQSKTFKKILCVVGSIILALVIFQAGIFVGFHKASFSNTLGDNYHQAFGARPFGMTGDSEYPVAHGAVGKIIKVTLPTLLILGPDNIEKVIVIKDETLIREFREAIKPTDLKVGDQIVVIGSPDSSSNIDAELIRRVPEGMTGTGNTLPGNSTTTSTQ